MNMMSSVVRERLMAASIKACMGLSAADVGERYRARVRLSLRPLRVVLHLTGGCL